MYVGRQGYRFCAITTQHAITHLRNKQYKKPYMFEGKRILMYNNYWCNNNGTHHAHYNSIAIYIYMNSDKTKGKRGLTGEQAPEYIDLTKHKWSIHAQVPKKV